MVESNEFNKDLLRVESFWESLSEKNCLNKAQSQEIRRLLKKMMKKWMKMIFKRKIATKMMKRLTKLKQKALILKLKQMEIDARGSQEREVGWERSQEAIAD